MRSWTTSLQHQAKGSFWLPWCPDTRSRDLTFTVGAQSHRAAKQIISYYPFNSSGIGSNADRGITHPDVRHGRTEIIGHSNVLLILWHLYLYRASILLYTHFLCSALLCCVLVFTTPLYCTLVHSAVLYCTLLNFCQLYFTLLFCSLL